METKPLTGLSLLLAAIGISLATFMIVLDYSIANVSIPYIAGDLASSVDQGTYVITSFAIGTAIVLPMCGWLVERVGIIRLLILSLVFFALLSILCGWSKSLLVLVIARFLQGAAAGPLIPLSQTLIVRIFPEEKKNISIAFWGTIVVAAPIFGPIIGGWICYNYNWPWIFYINVPTSFFCIIIIRSLLSSFETIQQKRSIDWVGFLLLVIGTTMLQFSLDKGEQYDWLQSPLIRTCITIAILSFIFLLLWELYHSSPLLEIKLFAIRSYTLSTFFLAISYGIYFGSVVLVPLWLQEYMGYTPVWAGFTVAPIGIIPFVFSETMGKLVKKVPISLLLGISFILFAIASFVTTRFNTDIDVWHVAFSRLLIGSGLLFFTIPLFNFSMQDLPVEKYPGGLGLFHYVRAMMGAVGTSFFTTLWIRRGIFHHTNLAASYQPTPTWTKNLALTNEFIDQQASVLAINDCFYLMGWCFLGLLPFLLFSKKKRAV